MKLRVGLIVVVIALGGLQVAAAQQIPRFATQGWFDFKAPQVKDPVLQNAKETFIQYGCAYCHNVDLHPRGEAADLMHSPIVGSDIDGEAISQILKTGIPQTAKLSPMPRFSDLSEREMHEIVRWVHYARMEGRFAELMATGESAKSDAVAGKAYYDDTCASCHSIADVRKGLASAGPQQFKAAVLKPAFLENVISFDLGARDASREKARQRHSRLLENFTENEVSNLLAYLRARR